MQVLLGTTNPSKITLFEELLCGYPIDFLTLSDLEITQVPEETGKTPLENAVIKAKFYSRFFDPVICADTGLYFVDLPMEDPRQPGLHVRSPRGIVLKSDEAMLAYYMELVEDLGGKARCCYRNGIAVCRRGQLFCLPETVSEEDFFYMVHVPHPSRHPGWPLDSISVDFHSGKYFVEPERQAVPEVQSCHQEERRRFLLHALSLAGQSCSGPNATRNIP